MRGAGRAGGGVTGVAGRRILGNLDFEGEVRRHVRAGTAPDGTVPDRGEGDGSLSATARRTASSAGSLLRVFAAAGDRLWLPEPVAPERLAPVPGLPEPALEHGPPEVLRPAGRVLAWGESPRVASLRERWGAVPEGGADALRAPLHEAVWRVGSPAPGAVARVAHRRFCLEIALDLGLALPGARLVEDPEALEAHLRRSGAAAGDGRWVVKAPYSAAGRERLLGSGTGALREPRTRRRLEGLLRRHGPLVFEPWVERLADFGCTGLITPRGVRVEGVHRLEVDARGVFRGIVLDRATSGAPGLDPRERDALKQAFREIAGRAAAAGYAGPVGLDAYRWRTSDGVPRFHALGEVNPRLTFGLVARALVERLGPPGELDEATGVGPGLSARRGALRMCLGPRPRSRGITLLQPGSDGTPGAWLGLT